MWSCPYFSEWENPCALINQGKTFTHVSYMWSRADLESAWVLFQSALRGFWRSQELENLP